MNQETQFFLFNAEDTEERRVYIESISFISVKLRALCVKILFCLIFLFVSCASSSGKPKWVDNIEAVYSKAQFVSAVGYAGDRAMAEKNAIANLAAFFGQSIQTDTTITNTYAEAVRNGVSAGWVDNFEMQNTINTSVLMELIGAEIKEVWFDSKSTYYAAAVMEKRNAERLYSNLIRANQNMIDNLVNMSALEKNTLEGFSRYQLAATVADMNVSYGDLLRLIGANVPADIMKGDDYRLEAVKIAQSIPIGIKVDNDRSGRIAGAFASAVSGLGFRSGGDTSRYVLNIAVTVLPVELSNNPNKFMRMELTTNLTDTNSGAVLLPYNFNIREGHLNLSEAENRVYAVAERKINQEYASLLSDYLSRLLPERK